MVRRRRLKSQSCCCNLTPAVLLVVPTTLCSSAAPHPAWGRKFGKGSAEGPPQTGSRKLQTPASFGLGADGSGTFWGLAFSDSPSSSLGNSPPEKQTSTNVSCFGLMATAGGGLSFPKQQVPDRENRFGAWVLVVMSDSPSWPPNSLKVEFKGQES